MIPIKSFLIGFRHGNKEFTSSLSTLISVILLSFIYFLGIGLTSILMKITGMDFIAKRPDLNTQSYWKTLDVSSKNINSYYRPF